MLLPLLGRMGMFLNFSWVGWVMFLNLSCVGWGMFLNFSWVGWGMFLNLSCSVFLSFLRLVITLSFLQIISSDYPFGIFKLVLWVGSS